MDVNAFLRALRNRLRWVVMLDGVAVLVTAIILVTAAALFIDWYWRPPGLVRLLGLVALATLTISLFTRRLVRPLMQRLSDRDLALVAERRLPQLDGRLLSRVEGIAPPEENLAQVLTSQAVCILVPARRLPQRLLLSTGALAAVAALILWVPHHLRDGLTRLLFPLGQHEWTRTSGLIAGVERAVVAADEPVVVHVERRFGSEAPVRLTWRTHQANNSIHEQRMLSGLSGPWRQPLSLATGTWMIQVDSGDAEPVRLTVRVVPRPRLERIEATLTPPLYARESAQSIMRLATLDCTALPGSILAFTAHIATVPGQEIAHFQARLGEADLVTTRQGHDLTGTVAITSGGPLFLTFADKDGLAAEPPPHFTIAIAEDRKPVVNISGPRAKESVLARAQVQVAIEGGDDYGLAELALIGQVIDDQAAAGRPGGTPLAGPRRDLVVFPEIAGLKAVTRRCTVDIASLAAPGNRVVLVGRAKDANDITGPGVTESSAIELTVVDEDTLRKDLDRLIAESHERVSQARSEIGKGLASPELLPTAARGAGLAAQRAGESLDAVVRRWRENRLPDDQLKPLVAAATLVGEAGPELEKAQSKGEIPARLGEDALGKAERILASLLSDSDLTRQLLTLIERQRILNQDSRAFVVTYLTKPLDAAARTRQGTLVARQQEIASQVKELERRILAGSALLAEAQELVRRSVPAETLSSAAQALASDKERPAAVDRQGAGLDVLVKLLDLLRGSDAAVDLGQRAGELAKRQETIVKRLDMGVPPGTQAEDQKQLQEDTRRFAEQLAKQPEAKKSAQAAAEAGKNAEDAMRKGDRPNATREAEAAASLLRDAQRRLSGQEDKEKDKDKEKNKDKNDNADLVNVLRRLHGEQAQIVAEATRVHLGIGEKALDFPAQRSVGELGKRETGLFQKLKDEVLAKLTGHPIAQLAVQRVGTALERAATQLNRPALGERGLRMTKVALAELARLLAIAEQRPHPMPKTDEEKPPGNEGGQQGENQAPFPPQAELSLLASMQEELARLTVTGAPHDLAAGQQEVVKYVDLLMRSARSGSRPQVLLNRVARAALAASEGLARNDRGLPIRHQQESASTSLRQLIAEAASQGGSSGKNQEQERRDEPPPPGSNPDPKSNDENKGGQAGTAAQAGKSQNGKNGPGHGVLIVPEHGDLLQLPPELRERLRQAREQPMPPGALPIFERYLELLEGAGK